MYLKDLETNYLIVSEKINHIFPQLEHVSIFYKTQHELKHISNNSFKEIPSYLNSKIHSHRNLNLKYQWLLPNDIFEFQDDDQSIFLQLDILSEHDNRMLVLNFKSEFDGLNDMFCLIFPKEIRFLGLYKTAKNLTTDDKILIGELIHKLIEVEIKTVIDFQIKQRRLSEYFRLKEDNKLNISNETYSKFIFNELRIGVNLILKSKIDFSFSIDLIDYVVSKNYSVKFTTQCLSEAFKTISLIEDIKSDFEFQLYHLKLIENEYVSLNHSNQSVSVTQDKVIDLLDRLENTAKIIESNGLVINGKLIAQYLTPPVSPPAVTEILKKNINKIEQKIKDNPEKWSLIRKYLKPLRELEFKLQINRYNQKIG